VNDSDFWETFASQLYGGTRIPRIPEIIGSLWETCGLQAGSVVADICCGRGYAAIELAMRGATTVAIDLSARFIEHLAIAADALSLDVVTVRGGAQEVKLPTPLCASMILWNSLGHQDRATDVRILENARRATHSGDSLVLELATLEELAREPRKITVREIGDSKSFRRLRNLNTQTGMLRGVWEVVDESGCILKRGGFSQQVYPWAEIVRMMEATGWSLVTDSDTMPMVCEPTGTLFIGRATPDSHFNNCLRCRDITGG